MSDQTKAKEKLCSYCGRSPETPICRVPEMHVQPLISKKADNAGNALYR